MVDQFQDCEFWLPSDFLTDEDFDLNSNRSTKNQQDKKNVSESLFDFSGTNSETSLTESESDEDEFITGLTQKISDSTLEENTKARRLSSSPKSPLCDAWGEFAKRKMVKDKAGVLSSINEVFVPVDEVCPNLVFPANHPPQLSYQQMQAIRLEQFRRHQMIIQTQQNIMLKNGEIMPIGLPVSAWPPLNRSQPRPQPGSGMRAVFLGNNLSGAKKQCAGTGVFLPRIPSSSGNATNRPACSPVLIPDRVAHALNLNLETLGVHNRGHHHPGYYNNNGFSNDYGAAFKYNNEIKKKHVRTHPRQSVPRVEPENPEVIRLPQEWTY